MAFEVTTHSRKIFPTIVFDTAAYAIGDCMGGKITLPNIIRKPGAAALLTDLTVINNDGTKPTFNLVLFSRNPVAATLTDNAAINLSTDVQYVQAIIPVYSVDYVSIGTPQVATIQLGNVVLNDSSGSSTSLYAAIMATAANDLVAASDLRIKIGVIQD